MEQKILRLNFAAMVCNLRENAKRLDCLFGDIKKVWSLKFGVPGTQGARDLDRDGLTIFPI
jgi:hypothetical protein